MDLIGQPQPGVTLPITAASAQSNMVELNIVKMEGINTQVKESPVPEGYKILINH